jgi:hypothetical protein
MQNIFFKNYLKIKLKIVTKFDSVRLIIITHNFPNLLTKKHE